MRQDIIKLNPNRMKEKAYLMTNTRRCSSWLDFMLAFMQNLSSIIPREAVSFVFPRVLMFPSTSSRETSGLSGKQN